MEEWEKQTIIQNLPELIRMTTFNVDVKAKLLAQSILTQTDVEQLDAESDPKGNSTASYNYYHCLMTRVGAFKVLAKILEENKQTGAAKILKDGLRNSGIPKELEGFNETQIDVQGRILKLHEFFGNVKLELVHRIFRETISAQDMYDSFVKKAKTFVLADSSIPPAPPFYIPRFLSNRIEVDQSIFKVDCHDIFVFRNIIPRYKLSDIARPHSTDTSTSQLTKITCRFIYLDEAEDWYELKQSANVPIHLITYDNGQEIYLLEDTTAATEILTKVGSKKQRIYLSEDEFVQQQLSNKVSSVCICDTPGMGKTFLLTNIARLMSKCCTGTIVVFIQLSTFVADFFLSSINTTEEQDVTPLNVFKYVSPSMKHAELLLKLVQAELLQVEFFFDGFDEIPLDKLECIKQMFVSIKSKLKNGRIYVTSRPHMRHELERSLGVIAYDILPFNLQNQVDYLVQFWSPSLPELNPQLLENYAKNCLKELNSTLTKDDKEITGIPLLCRLIAEVYANKVHFYSTTGTKNINFPTKIAAMYQQFIELRFKNCARNEDEFQKIKLVHIWEALKLLFPTMGFHDDEIFTNVNHLMASTVFLKAGIIQLKSDTKFVFIHRTFAEYFAAEYFSGKLQSTPGKVKTFLHKIFNTNDTTKPLALILYLLLEPAKMFSVLQSDSDYDQITFKCSVVVSFVDFSLNEARISEEITSRIASFCASISTTEFLLYFSSCCYQNLCNILSVLIKAVTKWNMDNKTKYFTTENCFKLLAVCIRKSTAKIFRNCANFLTDVLQLDLKNICIHDRTNTLLHIAAEVANYEAVEYLVSRVSLELPSVLEKCIVNSFQNDLDTISRRENILHLLLNKNPTLIKEIPEILLTILIHVRLFKMLVKFGANLNAVDEKCNNCVMLAAMYMSSSDFHELVQFLLIDFKAEYLFINHEKWTDPLPDIITWTELLPETLDLLFTVLCIDINIKNNKGENLLFSTIEKSNMNNFLLLVKRGCNYEERGMKNRSLMHAAAYLGKPYMIDCLLSLGLDPNSCDEDKSTPLHYAAFSNKFLAVEFLVENGANAHNKNMKGQTAFHEAVKIDESNEIIRFLFSRGVRVNDRDNDGNTPLHLCKARNIKDCLLEMGADIHAKNYKGESPAQFNPDLWK